MSVEAEDVLTLGGWSLLLVQGLIEGGILTEERCRELLRPLERPMVSQQEGEVGAEEARQMIEVLTEALFDDGLRPRFLKQAVWREAASSAALAALERLLSEGCVSEGQVMDAMVQAVREGAATPTDGCTYWALAGRSRTADRLLVRLAGSPRG